MTKIVLILLALVAGYMWWQQRKAVARRSAKPRPNTAAVADEREARAILGVAPGDDEAAIRAAHRRLLAAVHPDRGGSAELARRINGARDALLRRRT